MSESSRFHLERWDVSSVCCQGSVESKPIDRLSMGILYPRSNKDDDNPKDDEEEVSTLEWRQGRRAGAE